MRIPNLLIHKLLKLMVIVSIFTIAKSMGGPLEATLSSKERHFKTIQPLHYVLNLSFAEEYGSLSLSTQFTGVVNMTFRARKQNCYQVHIHTNSKITYAELTDTKDQQFRIKWKQPDNEEESIAKIRISTRKGLQKDKIYFLTIWYVTTTFHSKGAVFTSGSPNKNGQPRYWALTSLFQPQFAHFAYPNLDRPTMKANFTLKITISGSEEFRNKLVILGNMPEVNYKESKEGTAVIFQTTDKIPTYVTGFAIISGYTSTSYKSTSRVNVTFWYPKNSTKRAEYEKFAHLSTRMIEKLEKFFDEPFPLDHVNFVTIKRNSEMGIWEGMENHGIISLAKGYVTSELVAHKIVHHWIGNMVTVAKWKDICFQEGLTTYIQLLVGNELVGLNGELSDGRIFMHDDASPAKYKLIRSKIHGQQPDQQCSSLTCLSTTKSYLEAVHSCYEKAPIVFQTILTMGDNYVPADLYYFGLTAEYYARDLVDLYRFGNLREQDWYEIMANTAGTDTSNTMRDYFVKEGYPLLRMVAPGNSLSCNKLQVIQNHVQGNSVVRKLFTKLLPIEVIPFPTKSAIKRNINLEFSDEKYTSLDILEPAEPFNNTFCIFNTDGYYYRVLYPIILYHHLSKCLEWYDQCRIERSISRISEDFQWGLKNGLFQIEDYEAKEIRDGLFKLTKHELSKPIA